jgi:hypothetical protein
MLDLQSGDSYSVIPAQLDLQSGDSCSVTASLRLFNF